MTRSSSRCRGAVRRWSRAALAAIALTGAAAPPAAADPLSFQVGLRSTPALHHHHRAHRAPDYRQGYADGWRAGWRDGYLASRYGRPSCPQPLRIPTGCSRRYASGWRDGYLVAYRAAWEQGLRDRNRRCRLPW